MSSDSLPPRLLAKDLNILQQLIVRGKYGLELVADSRRELHRNAIYVHLGRMERKGLIKGCMQATPSGEQGPPRRIYHITDLGRRALAAHEAWIAHWNASV